MCNCIPEMNKFLATHNCVLPMFCRFPDEATESYQLAIRTESTCQPKEGPGRFVLARFCPFCGELFNAPLGQMSEPKP